MRSVMKSRLSKPEPSHIQIEREIAVSRASSIFQIKLDGETYAMKLYHDNGDPGYTESGRDLNRYRCELKAYMNLLQYGVCDSGLVPSCYGYIDRLDPDAAILLEYFSTAECLNCFNYSGALYKMAIEGMKQIHKAHIHHMDIYARNILLVTEGRSKRLVWVDFDVATTFDSMGPDEEAYNIYEDTLVAGLEELLQEDQRQGLPLNSAFY
ncbi:hypothetical protein BO94DRAFT_551881 [Aspergillus sclerotioniger CBS 115572]|uniref:Protein kinase domain-containing protein n=1 Tax=Aspergillus sclerotioniger CBS 115572 TaxID=1450535 RepID=A0A317XDC2_9EURO|nr:hypothetical protein BO94DRAFT_551881 [Aspergillus sclerotioniger CBS 115572]PWY96161.1 hypothetical protein BO94DRAFT_551881 [Aspergillus sclerotioniger CBS 115572]